VSVCKEWAICLLSRAVAGPAVSAAAEASRKEFAWAWEQAEQACIQMRPASGPSA
jgi:hypothetical protein